MPLNFHFSLAIVYHRHAKYIKLWSLSVLGEDFQKGRNLNLGETFSRSSPVCIKSIYTTNRLSNWMNNVTARRIVNRPFSIKIFHSDLMLYKFAKAKNLQNEIRIADFHSVTNYFSGTRSCCGLGPISLHLPRFRDQPCFCYRPRPHDQPRRSRRRAASLVATYMHRCLRDQKNVKLPATTEMASLYLFCHNVASVSSFAKISAMFAHLLHSFALLSLRNVPSFSKLSAISSCFALLLTASSMLR